MANVTHHSHIPGCHRSHLITGSHDECGKIVYKPYINSMYHQPCHDGDTVMHTVHTWIGQLTISLFGILQII